MHRIRVLLAEIPSMLLKELLTNMLRRNPDFKVVGQLSDRSNIIEKARQTRADAVVVGLPENDPPALCLSLLDSLPGAVIVGLISDGRRVLIAADDLGSRDCLQLIQIASSVSLGRARTLQ